VAPRKPGERSAKKIDRFKDRAEAEGDEEKKYQFKAEDERRGAAAAPEMKRAGRDAEGQQAPADAALRKNLDDGRSGSDAPESRKPHKDGGKSLAESNTVKERVDRQVTRADAGTSPEPGGGFGGGAFRTPSPVADAADGQGGGAGGGARGQTKLATAPGPKSAPQMVQVMFVLRTVNPAANVAADLPAGQPPAAAARIRQGEIDAAAETIENAAEAAEPAGGKR
jgi:hypothetical protein